MPQRRGRRLRASLVMTAAGLVLSATGLIAANAGLSSGAPASLARLGAAALIAAIIAGAGLGFTLLRTLSHLEDAPEAAAALAGRLPVTVARAIAVTGAVLGALALADSWRRGTPAAALWAWGTALAGVLSALSATAILAMRAAVRRQGAAAAARPSGRAQLAERHGREVLLVLAGALAPAGAFALGAGASPPVVLVVLAWLLVLGSTGARAAGGLAAEAVAQATSIVRGLEPSAEPRPPEPLTPSPAREARALQVAAAQLADRVVQLRLTRRLAVDRAFEADRLRTQFLANTSHDLRSPLHAILGYTELLLRGVDGPLSEAQTASLTRVSESGAQLLLIVQEVLDLARVDAGRLELVRQPAIVPELIEQSVEELKKRFPALTIETSTRLERGLPTLPVDQYRIVQAIVYLCAYAVEAATAGGQRRRVRLVLSARRAGDGCELAIGAPEATLEGDEALHLFDGFRQLSGRSGLGLGPHLAKRFIELHGGQVQVSPPGQGLRFDLLLRPAPGAASATASGPQLAPRAGMVDSAG